MADNSYISKRRLQIFWDQIKSKIPTKTSQLVNDSNLVEDANYVHTDNNYTTAEKSKLGELKNYILPVASEETLGGIRIGANINIDANGVISVTSVTWENVAGKPTKLSEFTNDTGFITKAVNDLVNYYKKTEVYTKSEVTALIGDIKTIHQEVVSSLPTTGQSNIIYLVPNSGIGSNVHDEYIWVESTSKFEKIGSTEVDMSNYWSKAELTEATESEILALFN